MVGPGGGAGLMGQPLARLVEGQTCRQRGGRRPPAVEPRQAGPAAHDQRHAAGHVDLEERTAPSAPAARGGRGPPPPSTRAGRAPPRTISAMRPVTSPSRSAPPPPPRPPAVDPAPAVEPMPASPPFA